jgi:hypothetical protein
MSAALDALTVNWEEGGELKVKELARYVLSKGSWATVMFFYVELDPKTKEYREPKITIRRYRKRGDAYMYQSKFNFSSEAQAREIARVLDAWYSNPSKAAESSKALEKTAKASKGLTKSKKGGAAGIEADDESDDDDSN